MMEKQETIGNPVILPRKRRDFRGVTPGDKAWDISW